MNEAEYEHKLKGYDAEIRLVKLWLADPKRGDGKNSRKNVEIWLRRLEDERDALKKGWASRNSN